MNGKSVLEHAVYKALQGLIDPTGIERFGLLAKYKPMRPHSNARPGTGTVPSTCLTQPRALEVVHGH
jgi:hypothetical protein